MAKVTAWSLERDAATQAARRAGSTLLDWSGKISVRVKGINDLVTEADHAAQEVLRDFLGRRFPRDGFLAEEGEGRVNPEAERCWIVDPLDGTTNYVHGFPFYCVSIGLEVKGKVVVGVVHDPVRNESFVAAAGGGATRNDTPLRVSATEGAGDALVCGGVPADPERARRSLEEFTRLSGTARSVRRMGSAALALAYVAAGRMDGYWHTALHPWDAAAGALLVLEAGGRVTNLDQPGYDVYRPDIVASNGLIHDELTRAVATAGAGLASS